jgi:hypothetical protein
MVQWKIDPTFLSLFVGVKLHRHTVQSKLLIEVQCVIGHERNGGEMDPATDPRLVFSFSILVEAIFSIAFKITFLVFFSLFFLFRTLRCIP